MSGVINRYFFFILVPMVLGVAVAIVGIIMMAGVFGNSAQAIFVIVVGVCFLGIGVLFIFYRALMIKQQESEGKYQEARVRYEAMQQMYDKIMKEEAKQ